MTDQNGQQGTALTRADEAASRTPVLNADEATFKTAQRMALALASSTIVPEAYQNNPANVMVAMEYANRLNASVLAVMQNIDVIYGRPALRSSFAIGTVNATKRFTPLRFRFIGERGSDSWGCYAVAKDVASGEECEGPEVTIAIAKAEGWVDKKGSKWKTIPKLMLMYRAGSWWTRVYCPELLLGLQTSDEVEDIHAAVAVTPERVQTIAAALDATDDAPTPIPSAPVAEAETDELSVRDQLQEAITSLLEADLSKDEQANVREAAEIVEDESAPDDKLLQWVVQLKAIQRRHGVVVQTALV